MCDQLFHVTSCDIIAALRHLCAAHPKLQSVNVATDLLAEEFTTVQEFVARHTDLCALRLVDFGVYDAHMVGEARCKIIFEDSELIDLLPSSRKLLTHGLIGVQDEWYKVSGGRSWDREKRAVLLALWLGCYEIHREEEFNPSAFARRSTAEKTIVEQLCVDKGLYRFQNVMPFKSAHLPDDVTLASVNKGEHTPELVEWANDFIGFGIRNLDTLNDIMSPDSSSVSVSEYDSDDGMIFYYRASDWID